MSISDKLDPEVRTVHARARVGLGAFVVLELVALPLMIWWGSDGWFGIDDWDFLATREAGDVGGLLRPHFAHWTTLPALAYRGLWPLAGLRSYVPYVALSVASHLVVVALVRAVMRRSGVDSILATLAVTVLLFFGPGAENALVGFQITFLWALGFGLVQLLLADHPGPHDWRDLAALLAGLLGLMCSGVALAMVVAVGVAVLLRRGLVAALAQVVPLMVIYVTWMLLAPEGQPTDRWTADSPLDAARFVLTGASAVFGRVTGIPGVGVLVAAVLVAGIAAAIASRGLRSFADAAALPLGLLVAALAFLVMTAGTRSGAVYYFGDAPPADPAVTSRYLYVVMALVLPAIACSAGALVRRWRRLAVPVIAILLLGLPGNTAQFADYGSAGPGLRQRQLLAIAELPIARQLPRGLEPEPVIARGVTVGWLLDARASGRLPESEPLTDAQAADATVAVVLSASPARSGRADGACQLLDDATTITLDDGDRVTVTGGIVDVYVLIGNARSRPKELYPRFSPYLALAGPVALLLEPRPGAQWSVEGPARDAGEPCVAGRPGAAP